MSTLRSAIIVAAEALLAKETLIYRTCKTCNMKVFFEKVVYRPNRNPLYCEAC